jgi:carboxyl-terminal processing protease
MSISLSLLTGDAVGAERPRGPELCRDGAAAETKEEVRRSEVVTNEQLVEEAWEVVNEGFLPDAGSRPWSPEMWMKKKQDIVQTSIRSRSRAHDIIQKMLANLGDPYTRFLTPSEF